MGTTQAFYGLVHNLNYFKERWSLFVALAPPISMIGMRNYRQLKFLTDEKTSHIIANTMRQMRVYEISPSNMINKVFYTTVCLVAPDICKVAEYLMADTNPELNSQVSTQVYFAHYPSGSSLKQLEHFT